MQNETFWRRLVESKVNDVLKLQKLQHDSKTSWEQIGLELKFTEIIENYEKTDLDSSVVVEHLNELTGKLESVVENILIKKLKTGKSYQKNPFNKKARIVNFSSDECIHGSLEFLGGLKSLKSLSIKLDPGQCGCSYERRFFQIAVSDIENIGKALNSLTKLESFAIYQSDLSEWMKIHHLLTPMMKMDNLKMVDLSYCSISTKESGEVFDQFLSFSRSIEHLELKGNNLDSEFCFHLSHGIKSFAGKLDYLGLSMTPIFKNGLSLIVKSISEKNNVRRLDISNCDITLNGASDGCIEELVSLIEGQGSLREIKRNENQITSEMSRENFIKALERNYEIDGIDCENCGKNVV